jgi:hypothetical protein
MPIALTTRWLGIAALAAAGVVVSFHAIAQVGQKPEAKVEPGGGPNPFIGFDPLATCASEIDRQVSAADAHMRVRGSRNTYTATHYRSDHQRSFNSWSPSCGSDFLSRLTIIDKENAEREQRIASQERSANNAQMRAAYEQTRAQVDAENCGWRAIKQRVAEYCGVGRKASPQPLPLNSSHSQPTTPQRPMQPPSIPSVQSSQTFLPRPVQPSAPSVNSVPPSPMLAGNSTNPQSVLQDIVNNERSRPPADSENDIRMHYQAAERAARRAFNDVSELKKTKIHNNANDATQCLKVEPTSVRSEWGIQGRFRLINTCNFPVEASWCANELECTSGHGNLWTLRGGTDWPIFFASLTSPMIRVGACKALWAKQPFPSEAALARTGGINARHNYPPSAPGVGRMTGHLCE